MELGLVDSIKFEIGVTPRASEYVRICTDHVEQPSFEFNQIIDGETSFAEALSKHAINRRETVHDVGSFRWTLVDIPSGQTSLQLWSLDRAGYATPGADMPYEYQVFEVTVDFEKLVRAYRFMLKQYLTEYDLYDFSKALSKELALKELGKVEKLT